MNGRYIGISPKTAIAVDLYLKVLRLWHYSQKIPSPKLKKNLCCGLKDLRSLLWVWTAL